MPPRRPAWLLYVADVWGQLGENQAERKALQEALTDAAGGQTRRWKKESVLQGDRAERLVPHLLARGLMDPAAFGATGPPAELLPVAAPAAAAAPPPAEAQPPRPATAAPLSPDRPRMRPRSSSAEARDERDKVRTDLESRNRLAQELERERQRLDGLATRQSAELAAGRDALSAARASDARREETGRHLMEQLDSARDSEHRFQERERDLLRQLEEAEADQARTTAEIHAHWRNRLHATEEELRESETAYQRRLAEVQASERSALVEAARLRTQGGGALEAAEARAERFRLEAVHLKDAREGEIAQLKARLAEALHRPRALSTGTSPSPPAAATLERAAGTSPPPPPAEPIDPALGPSEAELLVSLEDSRKRAAGLEFELMRHRAEELMRKAGVARGESRAAGTSPPPPTVDSGTQPPPVPMLERSAGTSPPPPTVDSAAATTPPPPTVDSGTSARVSTSEAATEPPSAVKKPMPRGGESASRAHVRDPTVVHPPGGAQPAPRTDTPAEPAPRAEAEAGRGTADPAARAEPEGTVDLLAPTFAKRAQDTSRKQVVAKRRPDPAGPREQPGGEARRVSEAIGFGKRRAETGRVTLPKAPRVTAADIRSFFR